MPIRRRIIGFLQPTVGSLPGDEHGHQFLNDGAVAEPARRDHVFLDPRVGVVVPTNPIIELAKDLAPLFFGPVLEIPRRRVLKVRGAAGSFLMFD